MRWSAKLPSRARWWFAWHPVRINSEWVWLEWLEWEDRGIYWCFTEDGVERVRPQGNCF